VGYLIIDWTWAGGRPLCPKAPVMPELDQSRPAPLQDPDIPATPSRRARPASSSNPSPTRRAIRSGSSCSASGRRSSTGSWRFPRLQDSVSSFVRTRWRSTASGSAERVAAMLSGVFFDLDETLIDADGCHREASRRAFAAFGMDWDEALSRTGPFFGRRMREILEARRNALGVDELAAPVE